MGDINEVNVVHDSNTNYPYWGLKLNDQNETIYPSNTREKKKYIEKSKASVYAASRT